MIQKIESVGELPSMQVMSWKKSVEQVLKLQALEDLNKKTPSCNQHPSTPPSTVITDNLGGSIVFEREADAIKEKIIERSQQLEGKKLYQIIFDNLDFFVKAKHMSSESKNKSIHWVHVLLVRDRVTGENLDDTKPLRPALSLKNSDFVPSLQHHNDILKTFVPIVANILVDNIPAFACFKGTTVRHIPHKYSDVMSQASDQVGTRNNLLIKHPTSLAIRAKPTNN